MFSLDECEPCQPAKTMLANCTDLNLPVTMFATDDRSLNELQFCGSNNNEALSWMRIDDDKHDVVVPEVFPSASRGFGFLDLLGNPCDPSQVGFDSCLSTTRSLESAVEDAASNAMAPFSSTTSTPALNNNGNEADKGIAPADQSSTTMDREARVLRYREKRKRRRFQKQIRYASRKAYAEMRPRVKGRFVKAVEVGQAPAPPAPCIPNQLAMPSWFHV